LDRSHLAVSFGLEAAALGIRSQPANSNPIKPVPQLYVAAARTTIGQILFGDKRKETADESPALTMINDVRMGERPHHSQTAE
jgi:hypothetical protein